MLSALSQDDTALERTEPRQRPVPARTLTLLHGTSAVDSCQLADFHRQAGTQRPFPVPPLLLLWEENGVFTPYFSWPCVLASLFPSSLYNVSQ